jgi:NAD(P)H-hydrate epimerase
MAHPIEEDAGHMVGNAFLTWLFARRRFDAIAVGPGMGQSTDTAAIVGALLKMHDVPLVLDADALNLSAASPEGLAGVRQSGGGAMRVLTPHHAEAARLLGVSAGEVAADREGAVRRLAEESGAVAVLKGHGTLVAVPGDGEVAICEAGNPGMATGGSGDVLTGMIASLIGQGVAPDSAVRVGVWLHATAGDLAAARLGERSMLARDIIEEIPGAMRAANVAGM